jgi:hypothetical protein
MRQRNRIALFLILPIVIFIWFIGWSLYCTGSRKESAKQKEISDQKELTFTVLLPEQKYAT